MNAAFAAPVALNSIPADGGQRRAAMTVLAVSGAFVLGAAPFARVQLPEVWAFLPIYQSAYVMVSLVTAVLLLGQFHLVRSRAMLLLAGAYLFDALMAGAHGLSFPGLFAPSGLLGAGPQTTAWLYFLWHGGFPLFVAGYALLKGGPHDTLPPAASGGRAILAATSMVLATAGGLTLLATAGHDLLPVIMAGNRDASTKIIVATLTWMFSLGALVILWRRQPHSLLDLWLMVVVGIWIFDTALAALLNKGRFDVGWYAGRICGLFAGSLVLVMLLLENNALYLRLARQRDEELRHSSEQLAASEARFRSLFDLAPLPLAFVARDGRIVARNDRFQQVFGYAPAELAHIDDWWRLAYPDAAYRESVRATWGAAVARAIDTGGDVEPGIYRISCKDGSLRDMVVSGIALPDGLLATFFDVTAQKRAEQALAAALDEQKAGRLAALNQMEDANAARREVLELNADLERRVAERTAELTTANRELDAFAYAVSHDLRAPLRAMSGFSRALVEDYGDRLDDEARNYLGQIDIAARRMGELIDGILALSRSTRGELRREEIDLSAQATARLEELARQHPERRVAWEVQPGLAVQGDAPMIGAVLDNLLGNAWKYTGCRESASIRVHAGAVGDQHGICISDNGAGFAMDHAARLFKPFQRLHRQDEFPGIGIGLATVQRIIHRHGGTIVASAEPGRGACFCFNLPANTQEKAA